MSRLEVPSRDALPEATRRLLDETHGVLGFVPAFERLVGSSPGLARAHADVRTAMRDALDIRLRARVALAIAQLSGSDYDLSRHNYAAVNVAKICPGEIAASRAGGSGDPRMAAAVRFALSVARTGGDVTDEDVAGIRRAGFGDPQIVELVALVSFNLFASCLNKVAETDIDFPLVRCADGIELSALPQIQERS